MSKLLPCPHCGEADQLYPSYRLDKDGKYIEPPYAIDCLGCGTDFTPREGKDARAAWNRRSSPDNRWPDALKSPQAEAIRNGKIDDTSIRDLFDKMERELVLLRDKVAAAGVEPAAWYREGFTFNFSVGSEKPTNATSDPNEWTALFAAPVASAPHAPAPEGVAGEIADAVLDWMVKYDLLDAGNEYRASDVLAVLNDLAPVSPPVSEPDFAVSIAGIIKEESAGGAACGWRSCSGCHETNEGAETGFYPYSKMFGCYVGSGCSECGGLGVVWDYWSKGGLDRMQCDEAPPVSEDAVERASMAFISACADDEAAVGDQKPVVMNLNITHVIRAALEASAPATADGWREMSSAPKDGTFVILKVRPGNADDEGWTPFADSSDPYTTIGFNALSDTLEDVWQFVGWDWCHDCFVDGAGSVEGWMPFPAAPTATGGRG